MLSKGDRAWLEVLGVFLMDKAAPTRTAHTHGGTMYVAALRSSLGAVCRILRCPDTSD